MTIGYAGEKFAYFTLYNQFEKKFTPYKWMSDHQAHSMIQLHRDQHPEYYKGSRILEDPTVYYWCSKRRKWIKYGDWEAPGVVTSIQS